MLSAYRLEIALTLASASIITLTFFLGRGAAPVYACAETGTISCIDAYYDTLIEAEGSVYALRDLRSRFDEGGDARTFCHPLLHSIGEAAGKEFQSVSRAYEYGDAVCRSGYYHGVLEGVFLENGNELLEKLDTFCANVRGKKEYSYDYFSCVHGIGHGLMAYFNHDVFESLKGCDRLSGAWEASSCYGGVFMENVISDSEETPSRFLRDDDPLYPCTAVDERYLAQCYLMQTSHVLKVNGGDFAQTFSLCAGIGAPFQDTCYQSIGRDASGYSYGEGVTARAYCDLGPTENARVQCLIGAAVDFIQSEGLEAARTLCAIADEGQSRCLEALEAHARSL